MPDSPLGQSETSGDPIRVVAEALLNHARDRNGLPEVSLWMLSDADQVEYTDEAHVAVEAYLEATGQNALRGGS